MNAQRAETIRSLRGQTVDVLVVGGGIVGAGIARDAALRGLRVALVEQHDFASGTSSRPTRLIHGGLRYLEQYDFGLVREDLYERELLLKVAPHLVFPLPFLMPHYGASLTYRSKLRAGMLLYDLLSFDKSLPGRQWLTREQVLAAEPTMKPDGLQGAWRYFDAQVPLIERMVVENVLDAGANGALILNHARAARFLRDLDGRVTGALVRDLVGGQDLAVRARITVNASGPWLDISNGEIRARRPKALRLTKGVHLVTPSGSHNAVVQFARSDGRLFFVTPWRGYSLVGTTDTDYEGDPANAEADASDVRYLQTEARQAFPSAPFDQVFYTWAGVRALARVEGVTEGQVSRKHKVLDHETEQVPGIVSVVGGKITAYRGIAAEVVDLVSRKLERWSRGYTDRRPFPGGQVGHPRQYVERKLWPRARGLGLDRTQAEHLGAVYGSLSQEVLDLVEADRSLGQRLVPSHPAIRAQVVRAVQHEWAVTFGDVLLRRLTVGLEADQGLASLDAFAQQVGEIAGWDAAECEAQATAYRAELAPMRRLSTSVPHATAGVSRPVLPPST
ncbi:MAG: glycerol-3-phosphate dehydrogenase [Chloroflexi bacterium]|nr:glycerol-3-phosphate dehydrogenase [Chloroflexota bacterium]